MTILHKITLWGLLALFVRVESAHSADLPDQAMEVCRATTGPCLPFALDRFPKPPTPRSGPSMRLPSVSLEERFQAFDVWRISRCLAHVAWRESRSEGAQAMAAVMWVVLNRARHQDEDPCRVVGSLSQFSSMNASPRVRRAARGGSMPPNLSPDPKKAPADAQAAMIAKGLAWRILHGTGPRDPTGGATHFHTRAIRPRWSQSLARTARIGSHVFYRAPLELASIR